MCVVSATVKGAFDQIRPQQWLPQPYNDFTEILRRLDRIDKALGLKDCKDELKDKYLGECEEYLAKKYGWVPVAQPTEDGV